MTWWQLCRRGSYRLWQIFVLLLILLALLVSSLRLLAPHAHHVKEPLQQWFRSHYQLDLDYQSLALEWRRFGLYLTLKGVDFDPLEGTDLVKQLESVQVRFELFDSLFYQQIRMGGITLKGLELELSSAAASSTSNANEPQTSQEPQQSAQVTWQDLLRELTSNRFNSFELVDTKLDWLEETGEKQTFIIPSLIWRNQSLRHRGEGLAHLEGYPEQLAQFMVDITSPEQEVQALTGRLYLNVEHVSLTPFLEALKHEQIDIEQSETNFQVWADFNWERLTQARLILGDNLLKWQHKTQQQARQLHIEDGELLYVATPNGGQLQSRQLKVSTHNAIWPDIELSFEQRGLQTNLELGQLDLAGLMPLLELYPGGLSENLTQLVQTFHGSLRDIRWQKQKNDWMLSGRLFQAGWQAMGEIPGVETLNAQFEVNPSQALINLDMPEQLITAGEQFAQDIVLEQLHSQLVANWNEESWQFDIAKLSLNATDLEAEVSARIRPDHTGRTQLFLYGELDLADASHAWYYFPKKMGPNLSAYLKRALEAGSIEQTRLLWHGAFADFPFVNQAGHFQVDVPLRDSRFVFQKSWPALAPLDMNLWFENRDLTMIASRAFLKEAEIKGLVAKIPGLRKDSMLTIEGDIDSRAEAVRGVIQESSLVNSLGKVLESLQAQGPVSGPLRLDIPLNNGKQTKVQGYADFANAQLNIPGTQEHRLQGIEGRVYYQGNSIRIESMTGNYHELPVSLNLVGEQAKDSYQVQAEVLGQWPAENLHNIPQVSLPYAKGLIDWQGTIKVDVGKSGVTTQIALTSDLKEVELAFPKPLQKPAQVRWPLRADIEISPEHSMTGRVVIGDQLFSMWQTTLTAEGNPNDFVWAGIGTQQPLKGTPAGVTLDVQLDQFDLTPWLNLPSGQQSKKGSEHLFPFEQGTWKVNELTLFDYKLSQLELAVKAQQQQIDVSVAGPENFADISYLHKPESELTVRARQLTLHPLDKGEESEQKEQEAHLTSDINRLEAMPHLDILCRECQIDELFFDELKLVARTDPLAGQWRAEEAWFRAGSGKVEFEELAWQLVGDMSQSRAIGTLSAADFDEMARSLLPGTEIPIKDSKAEGEFQFIWPGAPQDFNTKKLSGAFNWSLGEGHIAKVSDKGARIFTLLSVDSLVRKIRLDFSDVFEKGLFYNKLTGSFAFHDGYVSSDAIEMDGLAGEMVIKGRTNLNSKEMDYDVIFKPDLTGSLPLLAGLTINPVTGIYVLALNTVVKPVVEVVTQIELKVSGTTENPILTEVGRQKREVKIKQPKSATTQAEPETELDALVEAEIAQKDEPVVEPQVNSKPVAKAAQAEGAQTKAVQAKESHTKKIQAETPEAQESPLMPELPVAAPITVGGSAEEEQ